jgi:hypothetical protein
VIETRFFISVIGSDTMAKVRSCGVTNRRLLLS